MRQEELNAQMIKAADNRDTKTVRKMLEQGADPNVQDNSGKTALMYVCHDIRTDTATVRKMLEHGADPNVQ
ncbi:MAG: ankyrin repeat domain-containing protein, partial [Negativicutes bacterium]|nr:ankyrin repeat domain-containing protein [Clostridia bacterium]NCD10465.1 ankyrin repeat domain-containing protein [Negativicutes bacterium]